MSYLQTSHRNTAGSGIMVPTWPGKRARWVGGEVEFRIISLNDVAFLALSPVNLLHPFSGEVFCHGLEQGIQTLSPIRLSLIVRKSRWPIHKILLMIHDTFLNVPYSVLSCVQVYILGSDFQLKQYEIRPSCSHTGMSYFE